MRRKFFIPKDDTGKGTWLKNFAHQLLANATNVGISPAEVASVQADSDYFNYMLLARNSFSAYAQALTAHKDAARNGEKLGAFPPVPTLGPVPAPVAPGIFLREAKLVGRIKNHPGYTEAIGQGLGIIGAAPKAADEETLKPSLKATLVAGQPNLVWVKREFDGIEVWADYATGKFEFAGIDTYPDFLDKHPLPASGASDIWRYKIIYRKADKPVGQWSDIVSVTVTGM
jgi:hypothetical protein